MAAQEEVKQLAECSVSKEVEIRASNIRQNSPFEGFGICYQPPTDLMEDFCKWITKGLLKTHANKKPGEDHYRVEASSFGFDEMDFVVAFPSDKNWFYIMSQHNKCWNDEHIDVVFYYLRKKSKHRIPIQYRYTTTNCVFKTYINKAYTRYYCTPAANLSTQEDMAIGAKFETSLTNIIKGFSIPAGLPWHQVDEVYIPINCDGEFHWVLAVVVLKSRLIRVYDSSLGTRKKQPSDEIKKLSIMLPVYLEESLFYEHTERHDWASLDSYKDKETDKFLGSEHPFDVEFVQGIAQQGSESLDCGLYVAAFAEFLSDGIPIPSYDLQVDFLRTRYATLLWRYGNEKAMKGYVSENDDPPKPKSQFIEIDPDNLFNVD